MRGRVGVSEGQGRSCETVVLWVRTGCQQSGSRQHNRADWIKARGIDWLIGRVESC